MVDLCVLYDPQGVYVCYMYEWGTCNFFRHMMIILCTFMKQNAAHKLTQTENKCQQYRIVKEAIRDVIELGLAAKATPFTLVCVYRHRQVLPYYKVQNAHVDAKIALENYHGETQATFGHEIDANSYSVPRTYVGNILIGALVNSGCCGQSFQK